MSRISLIRPRRHRAVCHRPANDTRLLPSPFPLTILHINTHYKRCSKGPRPSPSQRSIAVPVPAWKVPGQITARPFPGLLPSARPTHPAHPFRLLRRRPGARRHVAPLGHSAPSGRALTGRLRPCRRSRNSLDRAPTQGHRSPFGTPPSSPSESSGLRTPVTGPRSHPLGWSSTSGGRDCPTPRISRVSSTSPQKFGAVAEPSPMWNIR